MRHCLKALAVAACLLFAATATAGKGNPDVLCAKLLEASKGSALNRAFAGLWLGRDLDGANAQLEEAWQSAMGDHETLTPAVADEQFKWQMRTWVRMYYLFGPTGTRGVNRLSARNTLNIEALFWNYVSAKSSLERSKLKFVWFIQGSENHDMMDLGNAFLAAQALAGHPEYAERALPDGGSLKDHIAAWTVYFTRYCEERIQHGLLVEFASPTYGKYYIPELVNLFDFAADAALRARAEAYLNLIWTDWSLEQLDCVRGGAKARCYQGNYSRKGDSDSWYFMGQLLLGMGDWANAGRYNHPILGYGPIIATSNYVLPEVVSKLATSPEERGEYVYQSRRPGRMAHVDKLPPCGDHGCWYSMDPADSRFVRYSWCTPNHILGSYFLDPALTEDFNIHESEPERAGAHYAAITTQNLWQGVLFDTGPDARIFPQCFATPDKNKPDLSVTYTQQVAVQHENVMLVQANPAKKNITAFRIYFGPGMKERLVERDGWYLLEEGNCFAAIRFFSPSDGQPAGATWSDNNFLKADDLRAPAAIVTGRRARFPDLDAFASYVHGHRHSIENEKLTYSFEDGAENSISMALYVEEAKLPEKNGEALDLAPTTYYQSPYLVQGDRPGAYTIRFGDQEFGIDIMDPRHHVAPLRGSANYLHAKPLSRKD